MDALFGPTLQSGVDGAVVSTSVALAGKDYVGIYFSGHCASCAMPNCHASAFSTTHGNRIPQQLFDRVTIQLQAIDETKMPLLNDK